MDISLAKALCMKFEGFRSHPYLCPAGYPTIGFGTRFYGNGEEVTLKDHPITIQIAETLLSDALKDHYWPEVQNISPILSLLPKTANAILDFSYNLGAPRYAKSTLRKFVEAENWGAAKSEIMKWNHAGDHVLDGLTARRAAEAELIGTD